MNEINNTADTLDIRDLIQRIEELQDELHPWRAKLCDYAGLDNEETFPTYAEARDELAGWLRNHAEYDTRGAEREAAFARADEIAALPDGTLWEGDVCESSSLVAAIVANEVDADAAEELQTLLEFVGELRGNGGDHEWNGDWYPGTLIRETYFQQYAEDFADELHGDAVREARWPMNHIDWDAAADALRIDYSSGDYGGVEYLYR